VAEEEEEEDTRRNEDRTEEAAETDTAVAAAGIDTRRVADTAVTEATRAAVTVAMVAAAMVRHLPHPTALHLPQPRTTLLASVVALPRRSAIDVTARAHAHETARRATRAAIVATHARREMAATTGAM
jgi:hypothetical protein